LNRQRGPIKRLLGYVSPYGHLLAAGLVCTALASVLNLAVYWVVKELVDKVLTGGDIVTMGRMLNVTVIGVIVLFAVKGLFSYGQVYLMAYVGNRVVTDLREEVYGHLQCMPIEYHDSKHTGEMISGVTNDVAVLQASVSSGLAELLSQAVMSVGILGLMFYLDWKLSLVTLSIMPIVVWVVGEAGSRLRRITGLIQSTIADVTTVLQETLSGIKVIKAFTMEAHEMERFRRQNEGNFQASMRGVKVHAVITPLIELLSVLGLAGVLWFGGRRVIEGGLTVGEFMAFLGAAGTLPTPLARLSGSYGGFNQALGASLRVFSLLDETPEVEEPEDAISIPEPVEGRIDFDSVSFAYRPHEPVLHGIELTVMPGEVVALVGPSGSGKTTIVNLIPRFYQPTSGKIYVDGCDISKVTLRSLRRQIGLVPQETVLFSVSIGENIAYGSPRAGMKDVVEAAKLANAHDFIMQLPLKYDTSVGEKGVTLSGGERQRIAIARAILRDPRILILDEATSSLDPESEAEVQEALTRLFRNRTTLVIAHRLSTIQMADRILVIDKGRIVESGNHRELMAKGGLYARLASLRFHEDPEEDRDDGQALAGA
jgi:subfamily B ATP-binding cassette protein MsbA